MGTAGFWTSAAAEGPRRAPAAGDTPAAGGLQLPVVPHQATFARFLVRPVLLWGHAVAWLIGGSSRPRPSRLGEKRQGTFGSLPVRGGSSPVECCLPLAHAHVTDP